MKTLILLSTILMVLASCNKEVPVPDNAPTYTSDDSGPDMGFPADSDDDGSDDGDNGDNGDNGDGSSSCSTGHHASPTVRSTTAPFKNN